MLSSTLSRMGCEKLGSMPGIVWSDAFMRSIRRSFVTPRGHSASGRTSTRNSAMLIIFGSVPSSGRPAFERTETTSGNRRSIPRIRASCRDVSVTEMPGGNMTLIQSAPSLSSGRNSVPNAGTSRRLPASAATAAPRTILRRSRANRSAGRYARLHKRTMTLSPPSAWFRRRKNERRGTSVRENSSDPTSAETTVYAIGAKIRPSWR